MKVGYSIFNSLYTILLHLWIQIGGIRHDHSARRYDTLTDRLILQQIGTPCLQVHPSSLLEIFSTVTIEISWRKILLGKMKISNHDCHSSFKLLGESCHSLNDSLFNLKKVIFLLLLVWVLRFFRIFLTKSLAMMELNWLVYLCRFHS